MKKPVIFLLDDDPSVLKAVIRDVRSQYRKDYKILSTQSANEGLEALKEIKKNGETIALFLSDQRMPEMLGVEFLEKAKGIFPDAKRVLLTAYSDTEAAIKAINDVQLDYYLMKPWDPPQEKLYPVIDDLLEEWQSTYVPDFSGTKIIGYQWSPKSHTIKDFLAGNLIPYKWFDVELEDSVTELINAFELDMSELPIVIFEDGSHLNNPSVRQIGEKIGFRTNAKEVMYDVAIIGAGPAGLAAAVYGGSEGLNTVLIEKRAPGGQAGTSSRIENYLGFPKGLSGADLSRRAITQATRFGIEFLSPREVKEVQVLENYKVLTMEDGSKINARTVIVTTGVDYRTHPAKGIEKFTGAGIYYGAATTEAQSIKGKDVYIVGGGNSAGQAAMYLSKFAKNLFIVMRKPDLQVSMSQYLIDQIAEVENIEVLGYTEVIEARGTERLEGLTIKNNESGEEQAVDAAGLFIFIGAKPVTDWISLDVIKDTKGYIETGNGLSKYPNFSKVWKKSRKPYLLETCSPGVFAAGDVRSGAMNRVASAVGEGSMAIKFVHEYLANN